MQNIRRTSKRSAVAVALSSVLLVACGGVLPEKDEPVASVEDRSATSSQSGNAGSTQALRDRGSAFNGHPLDDPNGQLFTKIVYFDFDSTEILASDRAVVEAHAEYLAANPSAVVILEGHADERGTREYNIALGEGRSNSVRSLMSLLGASQNQLRTVSYGEERPQDLGHDEGAWSANRRVEFNYISR
ncbi:MAG: peptidoglycan-associated lipoprotein Pal [Pseudomonadota bacterium]